MRQSLAPRRAINPAVQHAVHIGKPCDYLRQSVLKGDRWSHTIEPPAEVRNYFFTGTQHSAGLLPLANVSLVDGSRGAGQP